MSCSSTKCPTTNSGNNNNTSKFKVRKLVLSENITKKIVENQSKSKFNIIKKISLPKNGNPIPNSLRDDLLSNPGDFLGFHNQHFSSNNSCANSDQKKYLILVNEQSIDSRKKKKIQKNSTNLFLTTKTSNTFLNNVSNKSKLIKMDASIEQIKSIFDEKFEKICSEKNSLTSTISKFPFNRILLNTRDERRLNNYNLFYNDWQHQTQRISQKISRLPTSNLINLSDNYRSLVEKRQASHKNQFGLLKWEISLRNSDLIKEKRIINIPVGKAGIWSKIIDNPLQENEIIRKALNVQNNQNIQKTNVTPANIHKDRNKFSSFKGSLDYDSMMIKGENKLDLEYRSFQSQSGPFQIIYSPSSNDIYPNNSEYFAKQYDRKVIL